MKLAYSQWSKFDHNYVRLRLRFRCCLIIWHFERKTLKNSRNFLIFKIKFFNSSYPEKNVQWPKKKMALNCLVFALYIYILYVRYLTLIKLIIWSSCRACPASNLNSPLLKYFRVGYPLTPNLDAKSGSFVASTAANIPLICYNI